MRQGGKSREGMNFWYDWEDRVQVFYSQYGQQSRKHWSHPMDEGPEAKAWRKQAYAEAEQVYGITRRLRASKPT